MAGLALVGALSVPLVWTPLATAHEETALEALSVIEDVTPRIEGVSFRVAHLTQPLLIAANRTDRQLVIFGRNDEPFLRLIDGRVESNANSPLTYSTRSPDGLHGTTPANIDPDARPVWRVVGRGRSWSWFDPRIRRESAGGQTWRVPAGWGAGKTGSISIVGSFESFDDHGHFDTHIDHGPSVDGLQIELHDGLVPAIYVRNETGRVLRVAGRAGEPFLRVGPAGVFGNLESPDFYMGGVQTIRPVPAHANPGDPPRWRRLSHVPIWSWLEFRARLPASTSLRSTLGDTPHPVLRWTTPMKLGREPIPFRGIVEWIPPRGTTPPAPSRTSAWWRWPVAAIAAGAVLLLLRSRARSDRSGAGSLGTP